MKLTPGAKIKINGKTFRGEISDGILSDEQVSDLKEKGIIVVDEIPAKKSTVKEEAAE